MGIQKYQRLTVRILEILGTMQIDPDVELDEEEQIVRILFCADEEMACYEFIKTIREQLYNAAEENKSFNIAVEKWFVASANCWDVDIRFDRAWSLTERLSA